MSKKNPIKRRIFGYYLMLDIYDCTPRTVGDLDECYLYLNRLAELLGVEKLSPPFIIYTDEENYPDKAGLSGWIPFVDPKIKTFSGASIHTLTPTNFVSIDIFSCKRFNKEKIKKFTLETFKPKKIEEQYLLRGRGYTRHKV
jgi:S-adenosylmethionine decarboxylase